MHISLDSALGRQRRLNQVGETISSIAAPAAAYSLRSLTGGDPKVVRVRRESDNHEQDFTASEVSSGALVDFVNTQTIAPLDIQEFDSSPPAGRTGNFLIAKAAYSLRSLGTRQATVSATGDTVARADGKYVCQVRRSSDDALKSFTADEITDGTLLSFVNEIQTLGTVSNSVGNNDFVLTNASNTGFTATLSSGTGVCGWAFTAKSGDKVTVSFDAVVRSGSPQFLPRKATALSGSNLASVVSDSALAVNSTGSYSFEFTYNSDDAGSLTFSEGDAGSDFDISNFQVTVFKGAGHVKTWYDQSVTTQAGDTATGNHATQATAAEQPKIVDAGSLLTAGVTFDGGDSLSVSGEPVITGSNSGTFSAFSVQTISTSEAGYLYGNASTSNGSSFYAAVNEFTLTNKVALGDDIARSSGQNLLSSVYNNGDAGLLVNGAGTMTDVGTYDFAAGTGDFVIGNRNSGSASATFLTGSINEIIIYNSNQTDNRTAIEANIGEHYSISGIPAFDNSVNGFVSTWYDQSGNSNNVTQSTASKQPKIVNAGSLVTVNSKASFKFDGTDDFLERETYTQGTLSQPNTFFSVAELDVYADENRKLYDSHLNTARNMFQLSTTGSGQFAHFAGTVVATGENADADRHLFTSLLNGASSSLRIDGTEKTTGNPSTQGMTGIVIGANHDTANNFWDGDIQELIIYNSNQTSNFTALETNINSYYSIF